MLAATARRMRLCALLWVLQPPAAAAACPANCSLAGDCSAAGVCACDAPFTGPACERLEQLPSGGAKAFVAPAGSTTWGKTEAVHRNVYFLEHF